MLLDEVQVPNQLTESCKIYLASDLFLTELECLAYFNHFVTFPFLNCVVVSTREELVNIIPKLYNDLLEKKTVTLEKFVVKIQGMSVPELSTDVGKVIDLMCSSVAESIKRQCVKEYGFADDGEHLRATDISKLTSTEREGFPTNNCISELEGEASESRRGEECKEISPRLQILRWPSNIGRRIASHSFWKGQSAAHIQDRSGVLCANS